MVGNYLNADNLKSYDEIPIMTPAAFATRHLVRQEEDLR